MSVTNWIEIFIIIVTIVSLGIPLIRVTKKVSDLEGVDLVIPSDYESDNNNGVVISSK